MKKQVILIAVSILCLNRAVAQTEGAFGYYEDALLFSRTSLGGTARMQGMGGAQISLGGDINAAHANPAGLGFIRRSIFTFTPSADFHNATSNYLGSSSDDFKDKFSFSNLGAVFSNSIDSESSPFKGGSFAITMTKINDFNNNVTYSAYNDYHSILDSYIQRADGIPANQLEGDLQDAYYHYLINPKFDQNNNETTEYYSPVSGYPLQTERVQTNGSQYQWDFAYGGNFDDKLYFGLGAGINTLTYKRESLYSETEFVLNDGSPDDVINSFSTKKTLDVSGLGINGTVGLIYRPLDAFRVGLTASTPTYFKLSEKSSSDILTEYNNYYFPEVDTTLNDIYDEFSFTSDYRLKTPFKVSLGASYFIGKNGFISADIDVVDYSGSKIKTRDFNTTADNNTIANIYKTTYNYRIGTEWRAGVMRFRTGFSYQGDPYISTEIDNSIRRISGGLGYHKKNMFIDFALTHSHSKSRLIPYQYIGDPQPIANITNKNVNASITFGFTF